jgi:prolyl-tRNA synthetase
MRTRLFLRTTEFLWQEGHTCHATAEEAEAEARQMLTVYQQFAEEVLAMPVFPGMKSESEKFAGALRTFSIEAMMQDKKALQAGTSHNLSTNFAQAFETKFLDSDGKQKLVHQTSWGVSTRLIGGMIMTHSDDKGLVLPPRLAATHVVIVPIMANAATRVQVLEASDRLAGAIADCSEAQSLPYDVGVLVDKDDTKQPGWKFFEHEMTGTPIRIELGPRDLEKGAALVVRRDIGKKESIPLEAIPAWVAKNLAEMQKDLLEKARAFREANTFELPEGRAGYSEFKSRIEAGGFFLAPWCQSKDCEATVKEETKATIRCLPLDSSYQPIPMNGKGCMVCGGTQNTVRTVFARAY